MWSLLLVLLPLIQSGGLTPAVSAALSTLTVAQWIRIGLDVIAAGPEIAKAIKALHPAIQEFITDIEENKARIELAAHGVHSAFQAAMVDAIPGYRPDGSVGLIPNPDK